MENDKKEELVARLRAATDKRNSELEAAKNAEVARREQRAASVNHWDHARNRLQAAFTQASNDLKGTGYSIQFEAVPEEKSDDKRVASGNVSMRPDGMGILSIALRFSAWANGDLHVRLDERQMTTLKNTQLAIKDASREFWDDWIWLMISANQETEGT